MLTKITQTVLRLALIWAIAGVALYVFGCSSPTGPELLPYTDARNRAIAEGVDCFIYSNDQAMTIPQTACVSDLPLMASAAGQTAFGFHTYIVGVDAPRQGNPWDVVWNCDVETEITCWFEWNDTYTEAREVCDFGDCSPDWGEF